MSTIKHLVKGIDLEEVDSMASNAAQVYVHAAGQYDLAPGRIFIGTEDPEDDGFTPVAGDIWYDPS
jgi:hypothetical protein